MAFRTNLVALIVSAGPDLYIVCVLVFTNYSGSFRSPPVVPGVTC